MTTLVPPMPKNTQYCEYDSVKLDDEVHPLAKAAAALEEISTQELISDAVNLYASKILGRPPIKRRPPKPKKKASE